MTQNLKKIITKLPKTPGVYFFKDKNEQVIYIGKAINIKKRIQSHFSSQAKKERGWRNTIINYSKIKTIDFIPTKTEKDALILESQLVKKHQPYYNLALKDDKNFLYIGFTRGSYPRVFTTRQPQKYGLTQINTPINTDKRSISANPRSNPRESASFVGPFTAGYETKTLLSDLRKLFPYRTCNNPINKPCLYYHLGQCWAHNPPSHKASEGKGKSEYYKYIVEGLKALVKIYDGKGAHIECYDISNTQGSLSVGSMVTFINNWPKKVLYRKFKIKTVAGSNDPQSLAEIISRRLTHKEWKYPDLIIVDGGRAQLSKLKNFPIAIIGISKTAINTDRHGLTPLDNFVSNGASADLHRKRSKTSGTLYSPYGYGTVKLSNLPRIVSETILRARDEAHRFAITYHRSRQKGRLLENK
jgi:excinuclease UvrABC nuclease subunit